MVPATLAFGLLSGLLEGVCREHGRRLPSAGVDDYDTATRGRRRTYTYTLTLTTPLGDCRHPP
eukprot:3796215-Prymnesium_polylepis.1